MPQQTITFQPPSTNIAKVDWDGETDTMTIEFADGRTYDYMNVPSTVVRQFMQAPSAGSFFHRHIKGRYQYAET